VRASHGIVAVLDDPNLVSAAGLVPVLRLAEGAGLTDLLGGDPNVPSPNAVAPSRSVIAGMLAGADSIDDLDLLRSGGMGRVLDGVRAPSTLGTYLRTFTHGHVQQVDKAGAGSWPGWPGWPGCWPAGARPTAWSSSGRAAARRDASHRPGRSSGCRSRIMPRSSDPGVSEASALQSSRPEHQEPTAED